MGIMKKRKKDEVRSFNDLANEINYRIKMAQKEKTIQAIKELEKELNRLTTMASKQYGLTIRVDTTHGSIFEGENRFCISVREIITY